MPLRARGAWLFRRLGPLALPGAAWLLFGHDAVLAVLPLVPALALAGFAWGFARTLRAEREPLIARYIRFDERRDDAECAGYARRLTGLWALALAAAALAQLVPLAGGGAGWHVVPPLLLLALFLGEHVVRSLRFPAGGIAWPDQTFRAILRSERARHG
ncbi:hypothetical protein EAH89_16250 [Roseomonas nepalensis]|uniref:Uncharacterized protein n=1 Tax=Muricoccus nepalensis TaxID=1854500 RepID=A0A502FVQ5_9PROT|nr:hypothetical protein [Roseomonas nepalensis]TPG53521.1 hypothetical protein EAH89_16250 [Roseomonas nepalensis]